jgi:hypothetical protein
MKKKSLSFLALAIGLFFFNTTTKSYEHIIASFEIGPGLEFDVLDESTEQFAKLVRRSCLAFQEQNKADSSLRDSDTSTLSCVAKMNEIQSILDQIREASGAQKTDYFYFSIVVDDVFWKINNVVVRPYQKKSLPKSFQQERKVTIPTIIV